MNPPQIWRFYVRIPSRSPIYLSTVAATTAEVLESIASLVPELHENGCSTCWHRNKPSFLKVELWVPEIERWIVHFSLANTDLDKLRANYKSPRWMLRQEMHARPDRKPKNMEGYFMNWGVTNAQYGYTRGASPDRKPKHVKQTWSSK